MGQVLLPEEGRGGAPDLSFNFLKFRGRKGQREEGRRVSMHFSEVHPGFEVRCQVWATSLAMPESEIWF